MGVFDKIKEKFHKSGEDNKNRLLDTENNRQQFGVPTDDKPRNRMMDTISNEQGAVYAQRENSPSGANLLEVPKGSEKNTLYHSLSNGQAENLSQNKLVDDDGSNRPKNTLLDVEPNEGVVDNAVPGVKLNSDRVL